MLFLYDVAEAISLDVLRSMAETKGVELRSSLAHPVPHHLRFERPPSIEPAGLMALDTGESVEVTTKYYDYGVVSIEMELPFEGDWDSLVSQSNRWSNVTELETRASNLLSIALKRVSRALVRPYKTWLREDYFIVHLPEITAPDGTTLTAADLLASHAREVAQLVRGESVPLSDAERQEVLQSSISYSRTDLLVLDGVYRSLERKGGVIDAWRQSREAARLNTIRLDVMELTEKVDNAIKFLSDMFYARLYNLAAAKVGVPDYRALVDQKLRTAGELYRFMVDQFNQTRSFVLELAVVIILIIEFFFLFRGK